jgi:membrane carboxypeptidase/penicillin-binding protein
LLGAVLGAAGLVGLFVYFGNDPNLPTVESLKDYRPKQVTRVLDRNGVVIGELGAEKRTVVPYAQIPQVLVNAVVAAEDADYWNHAGLDYRGMLRAFIENVLRGRTAQGGSTITQQVVKTFLLSPERTLRRKVQEIILARRLSQKLSKEQILELYLNQIYYGHGRYGCEEAARFFFGKPVHDINLAEAALLAGLPQSPERLSPRKHPEAAKTRQRYVLGQLAEHGYIDRATADRLGAEPIRIVRDSAPSPALAAEAIDSVSRLLVERSAGSSIVQLGSTVQTTIDAKLQALARQALERGLEDLDVRQGYRGAVGHVVGKALAKHRAALAELRAGRTPPQIYEAILMAVEKDPSDARLGRLLFDLGGTPGVVDLAFEPRYAKGPRPLTDKLVPGDLVRVRLAPERAHVEVVPALDPLATGALSTRALPQDRDRLVHAAEHRVVLLEDLHDDARTALVGEQRGARVVEVRVRVVALPHLLDGEVEDLGRQPGRRCGAGSFGSTGHFKTVARAKPARPEVGTASGALRAWVRLTSRSLQLETCSKGRLGDFELLGGRLRSREPVLELVAGPGQRA